MSGHTPEPWCVDAVCRITRADGGTIAESVLLRDVPLLTSAPLLLSALRNLVEAQSIMDPAERAQVMQHLWPAARVAIAKATA